VLRRLSHERVSLGPEELVAVAGAIAIGVRRVVGIVQALRRGIREGYVTMATTESAIQSVQAKRLEHLLDRHKEEVIRLREELGDPQEALFAFVRDKFDYAAFFPDVRRNSRQSEWDDDDELDAW